MILPLTSHRPLAFWLLPALLLSVSLLAPAQGNAQQSLQSIGIDTQEFFLLQAFHARYARARRNLHHLGLITEKDDGGYRVSAVLDGFPAQQEGLRRGDILISIDDQPFHPVLSLNPGPGTEAGEGHEPGPVELTYLRNGARFSATLLPVFGNLYDAYRTATVNSLQQISNGNKVIGYVKLWSLDRSTDGLQMFRQTLDSLAHCDGLIIDLRDSYGFIDADHLDRFFPSRNSYFRFVGDNPDLWRGQHGEPMTGSYYGRAMVVIQNSGTRGGLELFSYQLSKLQRVVSVGEKTMGKAGHVAFDSDSTTLTYRPDYNVSVDSLFFESQGFPPKQEVSYPLEDSRASDPQLEAAMTTLMRIM